MSKKRVIVGLSGGVDSSVAAYLCLKQGYEVMGLFMKNWHDESVTLSAECPWLEDSQDALEVAEKLGIPFQTIDLSKSYKERIVDYMFAEYEAGRTPNPDILCNREIKYDVFLKHALELDADFVATGHYCRKDTIQIDGQSVHRLLAGADPNKDQSYFLAQLKQSQLEKAMFPLGHLQKPEVRKIAEEAGIHTAGKKDSQGLCFIGKVRLPDFLQQQLSVREGKVVLIDPSVSHVYAENADSNGLDLLKEDKVMNMKDSRIIGDHQGAHFYTIGQRKGLGIGGFQEGLYVLGTDVVKNEIYVGEGDQHPALYSKGLRIKKEDIHWIREDLRLKEGESRVYELRIRYRQELQEATLYQNKDLYIIFKEPQKAVAPGQFAAWYDGEELIGSGVIA